jgi:RNA polymerase sigma-70 factor (ECF subfamily)
MTQMEDLAPLLSRAARGEQEAYREIYRRFRPLLVRLASGFAALDTDEVEDVVQESFVRAFRALPKLRASGAFEPWLLSIARNRAMTSMVHKSTGARIKAQLFQESQLETPALPSALKAERDSGLVRQLIAELPEGAEKRTVELFYVEGQLTAREIAEQLGVGKSAITMRLERFRAKVKRELLRRLLAAQWE